jgi:hypothetical protein
MKKWFIQWLERMGRKRVVMDRIDNEPYLERYYIFLKDRAWFPFNVFLHRFLKSDPDDVHDHPWPYATLILKGGYYEWTPMFNSKQEKIGEICAWRGAGHFRTCASTSYHRIELDPEVECWTLFMPGPQKREWGFLTKAGWIQHEEYLTSRAMK